MDKVIGFSWCQESSIPIVFDMASGIICTAWTTASRHPYYILRSKFHFGYDTINAAWEHTKFKIRLML